MDRRMQMLLETPIPRIYIFYCEQYLQPFWKKAVHNLAMELEKKERDWSDEKLAPISDFGILGKSYYHKDFPELTDNIPLLREGILKRLQKADRFLRDNGLALFVKSGYRSRKLQKEVKKMWAKKRGKQFVKKMFSFDYDPHATGSHFDLEGVILKTNLLLSTKMPGVTDSGRAFFEGEKDLVREEVCLNRRLIHNLLTTGIVLPPGEQFVPHPSEYWHYGSGDPFSYALWLHIYRESESEAIPPIRYRMI